MLEELTLAVLVSVVVACIVFYGVQLKGAWVAFWLVYLVTLACGVGEPLCSCKPTACWAFPSRVCNKEPRCILHRLSPSATNPR